ncbi:MAG TPA: CoA-transferase [Methylomirabilota bacterium]|nr:CoA-transferase [Methylomirabilota bacterium]
MSRPGPGPIGRAERAPGAAELVTVALARLLHEGEVACHGVNSIVASLAILLARRLHAPGLRHLAIGGGLDAAPATVPASSSGPAWLAGSPTVLSNVEIYQLALRGRVDVMLLGAVQVDVRGRVNSTVVGPFARPTVRLPGGGGAAVLFQVVKRIIVYRTRHDPRSLVPSVDFVTATGNLERVVTPLAIFRGTADGLRLEALMPGATLAEVRQATGFPVVPADDCAPLAPPTAEELAALEALDPDRLRDHDFR